MELEACQDKIGYTLHQTEFNLPLRAPSLCIVMYHHKHEGTVTSVGWDKSIQTSYSSSLTNQCGSTLDCYIKGPKIFIYKEREQHTGTANQNHSLGICFLRALEPISKSPLLGAPSHLGIIATCSSTPHNPTPHQAWHLTSPMAYLLFHQEPLSSDKKKTLTICFSALWFSLFFFLLHITNLLFYRIDITN